MCDSHWDAHQPRPQALDGPETRKPQGVSAHQFLKFKMIYIESLNQKLQDCRVKDGSRYKRQNRRLGNAVYCAVSV